MQSRIVYTPREVKKKRVISKRNLIVSGAVILGLLFFSGVAYLLRLPYFQIKHMEITGLVSLSEGEIVAELTEDIRGNSVFVFPRSSIFLIHPEKLTQHLKEKFPHIGSIELTRIMPDTLRLIVQERKLWGILCNTPPKENQEKTCAYLDEGGFAMERSPQSTGALIVKIQTDSKTITPGTQVFEQGLAERMRFLGERTAKIMNSAVWQYEFASHLPNEIHVTTADKITLLFRRDDDFDRAFKVLQTVLDQEIKEKRPQLSYIDLRFGNKVFYKFR